MILGYIAFWVMLIGAPALGVVRLAETVIFDCSHCGAARIRTDRCGRCGVVGNEAPKPVQKKNSRSNHERQVRFE